MKNKELGEVDVISGKLGNVQYNIFYLKDSTFIMKLMSTYGSTIIQENSNVQRRLDNGIKKSFKYTETFYNHYKYCHAVDDHNNLRHQVPSIEGSWVTHRWPARVFSFLLAISETNAFLSFRNFVWP